MIKPQHLERSRTQGCDQEEGSGRQVIDSSPRLSRTEDRGRGRTWACESAPLPGATLALGAEDELRRDQAGAGCRRQPDTLGDAFASSVADRRPGEVELSRSGLL